MGSHIDIIKNNTVTNIVIVVVFFQDYNPKLSDFGLAINDPDEDDTHISTRIMGTEGYADPVYIMTGS